MIHFDLPKEKSSIIKVIGVGGGGSNAVNHMFSQQIEGVNFIICNTDAQAIAQSLVPNKVQLGPHLTQGLGAGANPEIAMSAVWLALALLLITSRLRDPSVRRAAYADRRSLLLEARITLSPARAQNPSSFIV